MDGLMECMCLQCGISNHLPARDLFFDRDPETNMTLIRDVCCTNCGGALTLIGRAGDEPFYRVGSKASPCGTSPLG